jgi:hypothetical protein
VLTVKTVSLAAIFLVLTGGVAQQLYAPAENQTSKNAEQPAATRAADQVVRISSDMPPIRTVTPRYLKLAEKARIQGCAILRGGSSGSFRTR